MLACHATIIFMVMRHGHAACRENIRLPPSCDAAPRLAGSTCCRERSPRLAGSCTHCKHGSPRCTARVSRTCCSRAQLCPLLSAMQSLGPGHVRLSWTAAVCQERRRGLRAAAQGRHLSGAARPSGPLPSSPQHIRTRSPQPRRAATGVIGVQPVQAASAPALIVEPYCLAPGVQEEVTHCAAGVRWLKYLYDVAKGERKPDSAVDAASGMAAPASADAGPKAAASTRTDAASACCVGSARAAGEAGTAVAEAAEGLAEQMAAAGLAKSNGAGQAESSGAVGAESRDAGLASSSGTGGAWEEQAWVTEARRFASVEAWFHSLVRRHFYGTLRPPFNDEARARAGFGPEWYLPLAAPAPAGAGAGGEGEPVAIIAWR
jgi:hypothetical protein